MTMDHGTVRSSISKGSIVVYVERVVVLGLSFAISVLLARLLAEEAYGIYRLAIGLVTISTYLVGLGLEAVVSRYIPEFLARQQRNKVAQTVILTTAIRAGGLTLLLLLVYVMRGTLGTLFEARELFQDYFAASAVYVAARLISSVAGRAVLTAYDQRYIVGYVTMTGHIILTILLALAVLVGEGLSHALWALALGASLELGLYLSIVLPRVRRTLQAGSVEENWGNAGPLPARRMLSFGLYNYLWQGGQVFREYAVDSYVIALFADPAAVAFYGISTVIPQLIRNFSPGRMLSGVVMPQFVREYTSGGIGDGLRTYVQLLNKLNIFVYVPVSVGFLAVAGGLLPLVYGTSYSASVPAALVLILFGMAQSAADPYYLLSQVIERPQYVFYSSIWGVYNLIADLLLVPRFGILGAAIATGSSALLILLYFLVITRRQVGSGFGIPWGSLAKMLLNSLPLILALSFASRLGLLSLGGLAVAFFGLLSFLVAATANKIFDARESELISGLMPIRLPFL